MRDTLNRRQDQERSQHSTTHNGRLEVTPRGQGEIPLEELHRAIATMKENHQELIAAATGSPFSWEIRKARLPEGFKLPTIKAYEGKSNPQDHVDHFNDLMELHLVSDMAKCRVFAVILIGSAKKWLMAVLVGSISSWQQLSASFLQHFQVTKRFVVPLAHLGNVKQKKGETLKSYINHFNETSSFVMWSPDDGILAHLTNGVLPKTLFWDEIPQKKYRSVSEFYRKASKFLKLEDSKKALHKAEGAVASQKNDLGEVLDNKSKDKRIGEDKRAKSPKKQKNRPVENKGPLPKYTNYHSLTAPLDHIDAMTD